MKRFTTFLLTLLLFTLGASAQTDFSWAFNAGTWTGNTGTYDGGMEHYQDGSSGGACTAGKILYQNIEGLPAGEYTLMFDAVANMAWNSYATGSNIAQVYATANGTTQTEDVTVYDQTGCTLSDYPHTFTVTVGSDGTLEYGLQNIATGGNWYIAQGVSLTNSNYVLTEGDKVYGCTAEIGHWTTTGTTEIAYNTWSVEEDPSGMVAPFLQLWVWSGDATQPSLEAATVSHETLTDLEPGTYEVSMDIRIYSEVGNEIGEGTTFNANEASADLVIEGSAATNSTDDYPNETLVYGTYVLTATVDENGTLDISINIPEGVDYNWIAWKNLSVVYEGAAEEEEPEPTPEDNSYVFVAEEWVASDNGRVTASGITYNADNTITVVADGQNNIALGNNPSQVWDATKAWDVTTAEYTITEDQSNFVIIGSDLATGSTDSYWWWMNGVNDYPTNYGQIVPDEVVTLSDGQVLVAWDISGYIANNMTVDEDGLITLNGGTCFGLTSTAEDHSATISDINFYTDEELEAIIASDEEPGTFEPTTVKYTDYLRVVLGSEEEVMEATVDVEYTAADVINFTLYDLAVAGTNVGNVTVTGITLEDAEDGVCTFSYSGKDVTVSGGDFDNLIRLVTITIDISGDITEEKLHANMTVDVTMMGSSLLSITADFGYSEAPEPEPEVVHECVAEESHWTTDGTTGIAYNTWSVEEDASGMVAPFLQLWVWGLDATQPSLEAATVSHETLTDLEPGSYEVSLDIRIYSEVGNEIGEGTTFNANGVSADLLLEGNEATNSTDDYEHETLVYGTYVLTCTVGEAGTLDISINIPEGVDYNWIAWKNLTVTYIGEAEPEPEPEPEVVHECVAEESHWTTDGTTGIAYNTWSVEEDASGMVAPFLQLWVWGLDATQPSLEAATVSHETLTDLEPGSYEVSLDIRIYSEVGNEIGEGTTFNANGVSADLLLEGNEATNSTDDYEHETLVYGTYVLTCTVGEAGTLDISINIPEGVDYNWIAWKNLTVTYIGEAEPEPEDLNELIAQYEADCTAAEGCEANLADMIENGDKTDETKAEMAAALEALEAVMADYGSIDTDDTTAAELREAIAAIEAALESAQTAYATGLQSVTVATEDDAIYTLSGVRVSKAVKGVYIVNGKKVLVK